MKSVILLIVFFSYTVANAPLGSRPPKKYAFSYPLEPHTAVAKLDKIPLPDGASELTFSFWVYQANNEVENYYVSYATEKSIYGNGFYFLSIGSNFELAVNNARTPFEAPVRLNEWVHYMVTWKSTDGSINFYINGELSHSKSYDNLKTTIAGEEGMLVLGQDQDIKGGDFETLESLRGEITEVNVWNKALNEKEVQQVFKSELEGNVVAWSKVIWNLDDDISVVDSSFEERMKIVMNSERKKKLSI